MPSGFLVHFPELLKTTPPNAHEIHHWARLGCDQVEAAAIVMGWKSHDWICCCWCRHYSLVIKYGLPENPRLSSRICSLIKTSMFDGGSQQQGPLAHLDSLSAVRKLVMSRSMTGLGWRSTGAEVADGCFLPNPDVDMLDRFGIFWDKKLQPRRFHRDGLDLSIHHFCQKKRVEPPNVSFLRAVARENHWPRSGKRKQVLSLYKREPQRTPTADQFQMVWHGMAGCGSGVGPNSKLLGTSDVAHV